MIFGLPIKNISSDLRPEIFRIVFFNKPRIIRKPFPNFFPRIDFDLKINTVVLVSI